MHHPTVHKLFLFSFALVLGSYSTTWALSPSKTYTTLPHDHHLKYEALTIPTTDGASLQAWYFPAQSGDKIIVMSHDGVENMGAYLARIKLFVKYGFHVMAYDYRGYGHSSSFVINPLQYVYPEFFTDFDAIIDFVSENYQQDIIAYGWGIGAGISITRGYRRPEIQGIVADAPFLDLKRLPHRFEEIHAVMTVPKALFALDYNTLHSVSQPAQPKLRGILYLHGPGNYLFQKSDLLELYQKTLYDRKELYVFEKSGHMDNFTANESEYARQLYMFVINL
ncbi:hypothetical protein BFP72_07935 [Reichenbachiella sp. 5M10]|uniref:alpha/beta hydrolase n=1 Tax=Reichenbachiella sp. 5M10 TaxID=1889772 RepID=UPI000C65A566|nr:alpha/beta hydrolase [Reichenbachiella sp. 5M10]PIB35332.1 hypothetical protein BFP72_07935 [Reichenbachiella sp. 5M10]